MKQRIFIVGDNPVLLQSRADLLRDWHVYTATSERAVRLIRTVPFDLLIVCQTTSDQTANQLIDDARKSNPDVIVLTMSHVGDERNLDADLYEIIVSDPDRLRRTVAGLLQTSERAHDTPVHSPDPKGC